jgi:DUF2934 family protein
MGELYKWAGATPDDALAHAKGYIIGDASAQIKFRRGVDLSLTFDTKAAVQGAMGDNDVSVSLTADLEAHAGLQAEAELPLDLFMPPGAGLVARFRAGGDVSASIALTATLDAGELLVRLTPTFSGPWAGMLDLVAEELDLSVGVWAHVEIAAEILGQAVLAGFIVPSEDPAQQPGFTALFNFRAGYIYGYGFSVVVNVGFLQPDRFISRLSERLTDIAVRELDRHAATLGGPATEEAAAMARLLIPLGLHTAYQVGMAIASGGDRKANAVTGIGDQLIHQAQSIVLRAVTQYAAKELGRLLDPRLVVDAMLVMSDPSVVIAPFQTIEQAVGKLATTDVATADAMLDAVEALIAAVEGLLATPLFTGPRVGQARHTLAILWSGTQLLHAIVDAATPSAADNAVFTSTVAPLPGAAAFAAEIPHAGPQPTLGDLVAFLAGEVFDEVLAGVAWLAPVTKWLEQALRGGATLRSLFGQFFPPGKQSVPQIVDGLSPILAAATAKVRSDALDPVIAATDSNPVLHDLLSDVADPLLDALPVVALAGLAQLDRDDDAAKRVREALAAIAFQAVAKFVFDVTEKLADDALTHQAAGLTAAADDIHTHGGDSATYHQLSTIGVGAVLTVDEAEQLMRISTGALTTTDDALQKTLAVVARSAGPIDRLTDPHRVMALQQLLANDDAPVGADLNGAVSNIADAGVELARGAIAPYLEFAAAWLGRRIEDLADDAGKAIAQAINWVTGQLKELELKEEQLTARIRDLAGFIEQELGALANEIANIAAAVRSVVDSVIGDLEARGDALIDLIIPAGPVRDAAKGFWHALLGAAQGIADGILGLVEDGARAASDLLTAAAATGRVSSQSVDDHVRSTLFARSNQKLAAGLTVTGVTYPITVTSADAAGASWNRIAASPAYRTAADAAVGHAQAAANYQAEKANCQVVHDQVITAEQAMSAAGDLTLGHPLEVRIDSPHTGSANPGRPRLQLRLVGVNRTFVEPTLGIPPRVVLRINEVSIPLQGSWWWVDGSDLVLAAQLVPSEEPPHAVQLDRFSPEIIETVSVGPDLSPASHVPRPGPGMYATSLRPPDAAGSQDGGNVDVLREPLRPFPSIYQTTVLSSTVAPRGGTVLVTWPATPLWIPPLAELPELPARLGVNTIQVALFDGADHRDTDIATIGIVPPDRDLRAEIATRAYLRWEAGGRRDGYDVADWMAAQAEILHPLIATEAYLLAGSNARSRDRALENWLRAEQAVILSMFGS